MGMSVYDKDLWGLSKVDKAIQRILSHAPQNEPYLGAYSGGKDSDCIMRLSEMAGASVEWHYGQGGIDAPEVVYHIRSHPQVIIDRPKLPILQAVYYKGMPRRQSRWCCEMVKEQGGAGRRVLMGIRWQESPRRKQRRMVEVCKTDDTKIFVNPIIDWTADDVWEFIHQENIPYCTLYDEMIWHPRKKKMVRKFERLGCLLCPMETPRQTEIVLSRFAKIAENWKRACYRYWERGTDGTREYKTPEDFWQWWLSRKSEPKVNDAQCIMFDN